MGKNVFKIRIAQEGVCILILKSINNQQAKGKRASNVNSIMLLRERNGVFYQIYPPIPYELRLVIFK